MQPIRVWPLRRRPSGSLFDPAPEAASGSGSPREVGPPTAKANPAPAQRPSGRPNEPGPEPAADRLNVLRQGPHEPILLTGMSETFTFVAPIMPKQRRFDPFALRIGIAAVIFATLVVAFAVFVVSHEHLADARGAAAETAQLAQEQARAVAASASPAASDPALVRLLDGDARAAAERTLALAQASLAA